MPLLVLLVAGFVGVEAAEKKFAVVVVPPADSEVSSAGTINGAGAAVPFWSGRVPAFRELLPATAMPP